MPIPRARLPRPILNGITNISYINRFSTTYIFIVSTAVLVDDGSFHGIFFGLFQVSAGMKHELTGLRVIAVEHTPGHTHDAPQP